VVASHTIPDTPGGRAYRLLLLVVGISSVVGIADHVRALFWLVVAGPRWDGAMGVPEHLIILTGWTIMCWCAVRAFRTNARPPTWAVVALPLLIWAYLLWPG
jgi:TRAP-type C4-dicarboxylate transport system permease small subunit